MKNISWIVLFLMCSALADAKTVYKYKDESGKWVFSDQAPESTDDFEEKQYKANNKSQRLTPQVFFHKKDGQHILAVKNPFHAPIEIEMTSSICASSPHQQLIPALSTVKLCQGVLNGPRDKEQYRWVLGDPNARPDNYAYAIPITSGTSFEISQSFKGRYSHAQQPSMYAVDIAMPVGTYIGAARAGTVVQVKDDYHMGGSTEYFLDKANFIHILHDDGTYTEYAHILMGSALVKPGDKVAANTPIARSGSSGYSTGPHLHFVVRKNGGMKYQSLRFVFAGKNTSVFTPKQGMVLERSH